MTERKVILDKGVTRITDEKGNTYIDRVPEKKLNPFVKAKLLATLKRDDITIDSDNYAGSNVWTVSDKKGKIFWYDNGWDYGTYRIFTPNPTKKDSKPICIAEMDWYENDGHTNPDQQNIFDIFNTIVRRQKELEAAKANDQTKKLEEARASLTAEEVLALQALGFSEKVRI